MGCGLKLRLTRVAYAGSAVVLNKPLWPLGFAVLVPGVNGRG
jgi:hypothetical protein